MTTADKGYAGTWHFFAVYKYLSSNKAPLSKEGENTGEAKLIFMWGPQRDKSVYIIYTSKRILKIKNLLEKI